MERKVIVFALEHYNPLGLIRALGENGIRPIYFSIKRNKEAATRSKYVSKVYRADTVQEGYELLMKEYGNRDEDQKPYLLFSDDRTMSFFDLHYDEWKDKFIGYNAGEAGRINQLMNKYEIQRVAKRYGFNMLDSYVITKDDELPKGLIYPVITKDITPVSGEWKADVHICQNEMELKKAVAEIASEIIMIQHFVNKKNEMTLEGYSINHGEEFQIVAEITYKYLIPGYYSPYMDVKMFTDKDVEARLAAMFKELGYEGIFEVEFIIDKDGTFYFMEMNFRASAWNYAGAVAGMPLSYLWVKGMENGKIDSADRKAFEPFTGMTEAIDYHKRVGQGRVSLAQWLKEFKEAKLTYYYNEADPAPFEVLYDNWDAFK